MPRSNAQDSTVKMRQIDLEDWWPWYRKIARIFDYSRAEDQRAADLLSRLVRERVISPRELLDQLNGRKALVLGAGPSIEVDLERLVDAARIGEFTTIAADGATSAMLDVVRARPDIIVSDLDGTSKDLINSVNEGSFIVVHGHGDNIPRLRRMVPSLVRILGSTQVEPRVGVYNFGGFTDGDRAVFLAHAMNASTVVLAGMDFGTKIGKYSKPKVRKPKLKIRKMHFGKLLLEWLAERGGTKYYNVTVGGEPIKGFRPLNPQE